MESSPPFPIGPGQRTLAAIVFTDVVNFSRRMHTEEVATLEQLQADFEIMRRLGEKHAGTVLKSTGDGLLLYFTSAVQAVSYATGMQRGFAKRKRANPDTECLVHRVGIHLGEVFTVEQDVMGDGVNIAARLQAEADPGGICISQTIYDVVKNKLKLDVIRLAPRALKNIAEPVPIYRVLLEPPAARPGPVYVPPKPVRAPTSRARKLAVGGALLVVLGGVAGLLWQVQRRQAEELARSHATQARLGALLAAKGDDPLGERKHAPDAVAPDTTTPDERMREMREWVSGALVRYTADNPLLLRDLPGAGTHNTRIFLNAEHRLCFAEGGAIRLRNLAELKPEAFGAVILSTLLDAAAAPPPGVVLGAEAFAKAHALREMTEALHRLASPPRA